MLNWLVRYVPVAAALDAEEAGVAGSVLDVGSGAHGLSVVRPERPFVGLDVAFEDEVAPTMLALAAAPGPLPFADRSFESVLSLDTLEHVPSEDRVAFVSELARVSARRVIVTCPSEAAAETDAMLRANAQRAGEPTPPWLDEHLEHGLPSLAEIDACARAVEGFSARPLPTVNGLLSVLAVVGDTTDGLAERARAEYRDHPDAWATVLRAAEFGAPIRGGFVLERDEPGDAAVDASCTPASVAAALRCVGCGAPLETLAGAWQCTGCQRLVTPDRLGVRDLGPRPAATVAPPLTRATERTRVHLAVEWRDLRSWLPAVSAFVAGSGDRRSADLVLQGGDLPVELAQTLLDTARARLGGSADGALVAGRGERDGVRLDDPADLSAALGLTTTPLPEDPERIVAGARAAKRVADELQAAVDRHLLLTAPAADPSSEPLVSVPIHTWNGGDLLVTRAISSVLNGSHRNVEVVVVSDGPDEEARARVARLEDPRVRFIALDERPVYAGHPYSFWLTAGTAAANRAREACRGSYLAPLDHDDAFTTDHIERLLGALRADGADFAYGQALCEHVDRHWFTVGSEPLAMGQITHGAVLHARRLAHMRFDPHCWLLGEPGDWNLWRRMAAAGAAVVHHPAPVLAHFAEKSSVRDDPRIERRHLVSAVDVDVPALAADVLGTDARWLLSIVTEEASR